MKRTILIIVAVLAVLGLYAAATYKYVEYKTNAPKTVSLNQYNLAVKTIKVHDGVAAQKYVADQAQITNITNQKVQACALLAAHKLVSPACQ